MADYKTIYESKRTTAQEVAKQVQSGWTLGMDAGPTQADGLMAAISEKIAQTDSRDVIVQLMLDTYSYPFLDTEDLKGKFTGMSWFSSNGLRKAVNAGYADVLPAYYRDIPGHILREYEARFPDKLHPAGRSRRSPDPIPARPKPAPAPVNSR